VEKRTDGRLKIERFWSGSLVGGYEQLHSVKTGVIQLTWLYSGYHPDHAPLTAIALLPCINVGAPKVAIAAMDEWMKTNKGINAELKRNKVKYLFPYNVANHYLWSMVPIEKLNVLDGLRLRSWGLNYTLLKKWNCGLVSLPVPEVYDALERKAVDATTMYISNGVALRLHEVVKYLNVTELGHNLGCPAVMNMKTWNKLPADIQKIIEEVNGEMVDTCADIAVELYHKNMNIVKEAGLVIQRFSPAEEKLLFETARKDVWKPYVNKLDNKGLPGTETLNHFLQLRKKYSQVYEAK
jgi:TRAP-type C4-dicarboxylate transport system substrate-binding protein